MSKVTIFDLNFSYSKEAVIFDHTKLELESGNIYLLTGENGSGKTTLMKLVSGLISGGQMEAIDWKGENYTSFLQLKNKILYISESPYLYDYLTGRENLELIIELFDIKEKSKDVFENINKFQLQDDLDKMVKDYSLGMRYKLFLAAAFALDVEMMLFDEPFSSLDSESQKTATDMLSKYAGNGGIAIVSTHISDYIDRYKSHHFYIEDRRINYCEC